jgi:hypothetical protein
MSLELSIRESSLTNTKKITISKKVDNKLPFEVIEIEIMSNRNYLYLTEKITSAISREVNKFNKEDE